MKAAALFLLWLPLAALPATAGFSQAEQRVKLSPAQARATVVFQTADGSRVTKAKPDCSCMSVHAEGSRLVAEVDTSTFDASVTKHIDAVTSDGQSTRLSLHFEVPPAILISSPSLVWERNAPPTPQEFRIRLPQNSPIRSLISAGLSGDDFDFSTRTLSPGREYAITITPRSTARRCMNRLVLKMDGPAPLHSQRILYLHVR